MLSIHYFFQQGQSGWSEQFYGPDSTIGAKAFMPTALDIGQRRRNLLNPSAEIRVVRVHDLALRQQGAINYQFLTEDKQNAVNQPRDVTGSAAQFLAYTNGNLYRRQVWLRGMPDSFISFTQQGVAVISAGFLLRVNQWRQAIFAAGLTIRSLAKPGTVGGPTLRQIQDVAVGTGGFIHVKSTGHGIPVGTPLRIKGATFDGTQPSINRVWRTIKPDAAHPAADWFALNLKLPLATVLHYTGKGVSWPLFYVFNAISRMEFSQFTARDTGAPRYVPRGRKRKGFGRGFGPAVDVQGKLPGGITLEL